MDEEQQKPITWNEIFRESREAAGLPQLAVSEAAGITRARYSRFETGGYADLSPSEMQKIQAFLDPHPVKQIFPDLEKSGQFGQYVTLAQLAGGPFYPPVPAGGKLTEHIAKVLEERRERAERLRIEREASRKHEEELKNLDALADLLEVPDDSDVRQSTAALLEAAKIWMTKFKALHSAFDKELREKLRLEEQVAKLSRRKRR